MSYSLFSTLFIYIFLQEMLRLFGFSDHFLYPVQQSGILLLHKPYCIEHIRDMMVSEIEGGKVYGVGGVFFQRHLLIAVPVFPDPFQHLLTD